MNSDVLILEIKYGGLGDHLFYSHIPRIAKETGKYAKVYVSELSDFRNPEYREFIWGTNPFVDGFANRPGQHVIPVAEDAGLNFLDRLMLGFGLDDGQRFHEPELYIQPPLRSELAEVSIYDPNYISNAGRFGRRDLEEVIRQQFIHIDRQMAPRNKSRMLSEIPTNVTAKDLNEFCSIIVSCKDLYCLTTGTATLAAALGKPATIFYGDGVKTVFHHSKMHRYIFVSESFASKVLRLVEETVHTPARAMRRIRRMSGQARRWLYLTLFGIKIPPPSATPHKSGTSLTKTIWCDEERAILTGRGIDIGCGIDPLDTSVLCFDQQDGDANDITAYVKDTFDFVYSSHCLEHMVDPKKTILAWWKLVKPGGHLFFIVPDEDLYEQGVFPSRFNPDHKATFTISKRQSWSPVSINVLDLVESLPGGHLIGIELQDKGYDRNLMRHGARRWWQRKAFDQTQIPDTLAQIQCIVKK